MVQGRVLFGAGFHFFFDPTIQKALFKCLSISLLYQKFLNISFFIAKHAISKSFSVPKSSFRSFSVAKVLFCL